MTLRILLILSLVLPQVWLPAVMTSVQEAGCRATSCCMIVETVTCCGNTVTERTCRQSGGACRCASESDEPAPAPLPPASLEQNETVFLSLARTRTDVTTATEARSFARAPAPLPRGRLGTQALLCIWRT